MFAVIAFIAIVTIIVTVVVTGIRMINANVADAQRAYAREQAAVVQLHYHYQQAAKDQAEWVAQAEQQKRDRATAKVIVSAMAEQAELARIASKW